MPDAPTAAVPGADRGVTVVTDSTCYLPAADAAELGVVRVPLSVWWDGRNEDETDVDPATFYRWLRRGEGRPTTSQPAPGAFAAAFAAAASRGATRVLCITAGARLSGTYASAVLAADLVEVPVDVVDSATVSGGLVLVVGEVARAVRRGMGHRAAVALARSLGSRVASTFVSDALPLLRAGGRLAADLPVAPEPWPGAAADAGVPVLALRGGEVVPLGTAATVGESVALQVEVVRRAAAVSPTPVTVGHGDVPDVADALADAVAGLPGVTRVDRYVVGPVVGAHAGAGNVGLSYLTAP